MKVWRGIMSPQEKIGEMYRIALDIAAGWRVYLLLTNRKWCT